MDDDNTTPGLWQSPTAWAFWMLVGLMEWAGIGLLIYWLAR